MTFDPSSLKALCFDVQGTLVDFTTPLIEAGEALATQRGFVADWPEVITRWRAGYRAGMDAFLAGQRAWISTDTIYREALDTLLANYPWAQQVSAEDRDALNTTWSRLRPWPDTQRGLSRLRSRYLTAALSNGSMASVIRIARHGALPFDAILTGELVQSFKPDPKVYALAVRSLGVAPHEIMMVASHKYDLVAARAQGFRTAFIARPLEFGPGVAVDITPDPTFDCNVADMEELATRLGA
ncbi:haloacid dehalogenase type II [Ralstonia insidiosa]|uniref:Haloacid dehalogenase, type II n=1 Tax=Ralstonia insidiosa TaxID=190721 RepID=A0A191ZYR6_9RALS|nr:haloacid dehalogenase type II [Ralstonia insidiosa]ANJ73228.1 haloacid dehalogenase, type II [Ralstonia insidiosa]MBY4911311.1 haloacid dehalogenase type II [Ralstonia insidiosa]